MAKARLDMYHGELYCSLYSNTTIIIHMWVKKWSVKKKALLSGGGQPDPHLK